ncbi:hypothetical protein [Cryptosporangium minutisporangium]|uniref:Uncharacterized protein n=1 Tax=Cryptosporangium minutisporangium TaxID=113569 RepID=A0ABP6TAI7_9ACTN
MGGVVWRGASAGVDMNLDGWNEAFLDRLDENSAGRPLYLFVDQDLLSEISGLPAGDAVVAFSVAFRDRVREAPFGAAARDAREWKRRGFAGRPRFVSHLAMTVLAVTDEPAGRGNGVYPRLNELLGLAPEAVIPLGYDEDVPFLWQSWNAWLEGPGARYGRPTAKPDEHFPYQGWARSQGVIRFSDRLMLEQFLAARDAGRCTNPSVGELFGWLFYRGAVGVELRDRLFRDEGTVAILERVLANETTRWHRDGPRPGFRRAAPLGLLHWDDWTDEFSGAVEILPEWVGMEFDLGEGDRQVVDGSDSVRLIMPGASEPQLLRAGVEHHLTADITVQLGGDYPYVLRRSPDVDGWLQCRSIGDETVVRILAPESQAAALRAAGLSEPSAPSKVDGWLWWRDVHLTRAQTNRLRALGLTAVRFAAGPAMTFEGGLSVGGNAYVSGGEPDLIIPPGVASIVLDGRPHEVPPGEDRVRLADLFLDPGAHQVTTDAGQSVTFRIADRIQDAAPQARVEIRVCSALNNYLFSSATRDSGAAVALSGAVLRGVAMAEPLAVVRQGTAAECLVLTGNGELRQVWPTTPAWLREMGIAPNVVDVPDAIRQTVDDPVAFLVRSPGGRAMKIVSLPPGAVMPGGNLPSRPRPDLAGDVVHALLRQPGLDPRVRDALGKSIRVQPIPGRAGQESKTEVVVRPDVIPGRIEVNPFDDVLNWLGERENGFVSEALFARTWAWLCGRYGYADLADRWRAVLRTLADLGHVERDFGRGQVAVAAAGLVALPRAAGLYVLTGGRTEQLLDRLSDADDPVLGDAAAGMLVHSVTPVVAGGRPSGPTIVYVEIDPAERGAIRSALGRVGVTMQGCVADQLLSMLPTLEQTREHNLHLSASPAFDYRRRVLRHGSWVWAQREDDRVRGLYLYRPPHAPRTFAWRCATDGALVQVDSLTGEWMARADIGQRALLAHHASARQLFTPVDVPLPAMVGRALTLRSGLPAARARMRRRDGGVATEVIVYENVDYSTADRIARLLGQELGSDGGMRVER